MNKKQTTTTASDAPANGSGQVRFDDRGNAVWETQRGTRLEHSALALADEQPPRNTRKTNGGGLGAGYDPYDSGMLTKSAYRRRKDLRALSNWIETRKGRSDRSRD